MGREASSYLPYGIQNFKTVKFPCTLKLTAWWNPPLPPGANRVKGLKKINRISIWKKEKSHKTVKKVIALQKSK